MALISITKDTFNPQESTECFQLDEKMGLGAWVSERPEDFTIEPWICVLRRDGRTFYPLRNEWETTELLEDDQVHFLPHVGDPISIIIAIIVVVAVVFVLLSAMPTMADPQSAPDPVSSIDGRRNKARLNSPIEDAYGRNKLWATYISQPYTRYQGNNKQILYQVLTLGHGEFDIEGVLIEDTPAVNFSEIEYTVNDVEVFDNNVSVCQEVKGLDLLGTNYDDYDGYIGAFALNPPNTIAEFVEIDYVLPNGAYYTDDEGKVKSLDVKVLWEAREIDLEGNPITPNEWYKVYKIDRRYSTNQTIRQTITKNLPRAARWEIRCIRLDESYKGVRGTNNIVWDGARAYRGNYTQPAGLTTINVKTKASLNTVSNKINVLATRKIPIWDGSAWTANTASRNPIWAMVNILKSSWGGAMEDDQLDLAELKLTADLADAAGETFDWVFDSKTTVWEAVKLCCQVCRSSPILRGSKISAVRDVASSVPVMLFNSNNIHENSLKISRQVYNLEGKDGLKATYFDHATWKDETVTALLGDQQGINPKQTKLRGITNRDNAIKTANYLWGSEFNNRETITFKTNHAGFSATYNDLIKVESDIAKWGQGGEVLDITGAGIITLSEKPNFTTALDHNIAFRTKTGGYYGAFIVDPVSGVGNEYKVAVRGGTIDETNLPISDDHENPAYIFGTLENDGKLCRIVKVQNAGLDEITVTAVAENYGRFANDLVPSPPIVYPPLLPRVAVNSIASARITDVYWTPTGLPRLEISLELEDGDTAAADYYISRDGVDWDFYGYLSSNPSQVLLPTDDIGGWYIKIINREVIDGNWEWSTAEFIVNYSESGWIQLTDDSDTAIPLDSNSSTLSHIPMRTDIFT